MLRFGACLFQIGASGASVGRSVGKREPTEVNCMLRTRFRCRRTRPTAEPAAAAASPSFLPSPFGPLPPQPPLAPSAPGFSFGVGCSLRTSQKLSDTRVGGGGRGERMRCEYVRRWYLTNATIPTRLLSRSDSDRGAENPFFRHSSRIRRQPPLYLARRHFPRWRFLSVKPATSSLTLP